MRKKIILLAVTVVVVFMLIASVFVYISYQAYFKPAISDKAPEYLYVYTGTSYDDLLLQIENQQLLREPKDFERLAKYKKLSRKFYPGKYKIEKEMSVNDLINKLRSNNQEEVSLIFNNIRSKEQLAERISTQLEMPSQDLLDLLNDNTFLKSYGFDSVNVLSMFLPNTYGFWWNTSAKGFMERMYKEYTKYWTQVRLSQAEKIGLTPIEVSILASIVEEENHRKDEQAKIAGLYMNRLHKGMLLQADPTVRYALGDMAIKRLLYKDLEVDSPYNTYKHVGLPPGPIRMPAIHALEAVLYYEKHAYLYMCAKEDFSGYHHFAVSASQHAVNAAKYHRALNRKKLYR